MKENKLFIAFYNSSKDFGLLEEVFLYIKKKKH